MSTKYTISVNIQRDAERDIHYIKTPNAIRVVKQLEKDSENGTRSFTIIGSYGTGKSSFLWALQQSLKGKKRFFDFKLNSANSKVEFINIIGEFKSIRETFADEFNVKVNKNLNQNVLSEIFNRYHDLGKNNHLFIIIDEFGKFLEYAAVNSPEDELYFIQQLAEFANNDDYNISLITTIHQSFDAYSFSLQKEQRQEWTKVKGRFKEITFNEPVEQLLFLAAEHMTTIIGIDKGKQKEIDKVISLFQKAKAFNSNQKYIEEIAEKLYPLDIVSANVLTLALQRYGQNERSLFSFLESTDHTGLKSFKGNDHFYNLSNVYDYLVFNFYSFINSKNNPDYNAWSNIKSGLERIETLFESNFTEYAKLIKTIGLLNIFASKGAILDRSFLENYSRICLGIAKSELLISDLEPRKILIYRKFDNRFIVFEGTDLDIQSALIDAENKVSEISDVPTSLKKYYDLPPIMAKGHTYITGTPRLFEYRISETPITEKPIGEIDGFVNLIFNERLRAENVRVASENCEDAILFGYYKNSKVIKDLLFEIEKTQKVIEENNEDKVAVKELKIILVHQQNLLNHKLLNNFYEYSSEVVWFFRGTPIRIRNKKELNQHLSSISTQIYSDAPIFNNELVNKNKISASIHTAKRNYFVALSENWGQLDLGFPEDKFPPEKTIYLSLLKQNGLQPSPGQINFVPQINRNSSFRALWNISVYFLNSAKKNKRSIKDFSDLLLERPFKLKQGLIDFWIPTFIFLKRDDFALFNSEGYIPIINDEVLELLAKNPEEYEIKTFDIEGVKLDIFNSYRQILSQSSKTKIDNQTFIETIKPFIVFYRSLPEYTRNTKRLSKEAIAIRDSISLSKDPENIFFSDFPQALGYSIDRLQKSKEDLKIYSAKLQSSIKELRGFYDKLIKRFEDFITDTIGEDLNFEEYKTNLQKRYKKIRIHLLLPHQKTFIQRLNSKIEDRNAWLISICEATIGNSLNKLTDEEEPLLYDKFKSMLLELDTLTTLSKVDFIEDKEDVLSIEIGTFREGVNKKIIRLPKSKKKDVTVIELAINKIMSNDKSVNIAALSNILKSLFKNDKN